VIRVALKGLLGRKLRLALTSLAIVLGAALVSGTYVLTDTVNASLNGLFTSVYANTDAVVTGKAVFGGDAQAPSFPASTLARIAGLRGVAAAGGAVGARAEIVGRDGKVISRGSASQLGLSTDPAYERFSPFTLAAGRWPTSPGEVAIDAETADSQLFRVGDKIGVIVTGGRERRYTVTGIAEYGNQRSIAGDTLAIFALPVAQRLFGERGELDQIRVAARPNVSGARLLAQIRSVLPAHTQVRTGAQQAQTEANDYGSAVGTLRDFLLAFGGIALFVGAFVIANTLSITLAQRAREFATLRAVGASARQVRRTVLLEGLVTGAVASTIGLFAGLGLATTLEALFRADGLKLPLTHLIFATRTIVVSLALGVGVTLLASLLPAVRATRVPPIAAVREGSVLPPSRLARFAPAATAGVLAVAIALIGVGGFVSGLPTGPRLLLLGVGVLVLFVGVAMVAPRVTPPLTRLLAWPATQLGGIAGRLARGNTLRNPARTASTAAALMIGLALVTAVAVLAQGLKQSIVGSVRDEFRGDYIVTSESGIAPTSVAPAAALRRARIASLVADERSGQGRAFGQTVRIAGLDPDLDKLLVLNWKAGSNSTMATLGTRGAIVDESFARAHRLELGSPLVIQTPAGRTIRLRIDGVYIPPPAQDPLGTISVSARTFDSLYANPQDLFTLIAMPDGVTASGSAELARVLAPFPDASLQSEQQFVSTQQAAINGELNLIYILLALSIVVSLFGIVNTLMLTVVERTRELGMLRAIGMTRRQTRRMIRHEATTTALLGAALGIPLGIALAAVFDRALHNTPFAIPWDRIALFVVAAVLVGLIAAILPARRASRLDVLTALHYE
jgi:putative ABC transport system permease protein